MVTAFRYQIPAAVPSGRLAAGPVPVDRDDPRYHEPLVDLPSAGVAGESHFARTDGGNWPYHRPLEGSLSVVWVRESIARMLEEANTALRPHGMELFVLDGFRPMRCQESLWAFYLESARARFPDLDEPGRRAFALRSVFDPTVFDEHDSSTWPAHFTGAAVDVTLRDLETGDLADMGSRFDDIVEASRMSHFERLLADGEIDESDVRLRNRRLLHWALTQLGFLNAPFVYWHFAWGTPEYIGLLRRSGTDGPDAAWYGCAEAPP